MTRLQRIDRKIERMRSKIERLEDERYALLPHREPGPFERALVKAWEYDAYENAIHPKIDIMEQGTIDIEIIRGGKT